MLPKKYLNRAIRFSAWSVAMMGAVAATACASRRSSAGASQVSCVPDLSHVTDSMDLVVEARTLVFDSSLAVPTPYLALATHEISQRIRLPQPLLLTVVAPDSGTGDTLSISGHQTLDGMFSIEVDRSGRLKNAQVASTTMNPEVDRRVLAAIAAADSQGVFAPYPSSVRSKTLALRLLLTSSPSSKALGSAVARLRVPLVTLAPPARPIGFPRPRMSYDLGNRDSGSVHLTFVVSPEGRTLPGTMHIETATNMGFVQTIADRVSHWSFRPAHVSGCPVYERYDMEFRMWYR
jgi:hypothetical protein